MKRAFLILIYFYQITCFSQLRMIKGTVTDTIEDNYSISIINNRYYNLEPLVDIYGNVDFDKYKNYDDLLKEIGKRDTLWSSVNKKGKFKIRAYLSDSLLFVSARHHSQNFLVSDLIKKKNLKIDLKPQKCIPKPSKNNSSDSLYIIIGKKIKVQRVSHPYYCVPKNTVVLERYRRYKAQYEILKTLEGTFKKDTITFYAYTHVCSSTITPKFAHFENSILYLKKNNNTYVQVDDKFDCIFKTTDNRWASPYRDYNLKLVDSLTSIHPKKISFLKPVSFRLKYMLPDEIKRKFPSPYYEIENKFAKAVYGNYAEELVKIKKATSLKK